MVEEEVQYERHTLDDDSDDDFIYEEVEIEDDDEVGNCLVMCVR